MSTQQQHYLAYMLRLWQVSSDGEPIWRAFVESPHSGERKGFASLDDLFDFLRRQTGAVSDANGDESALAVRRRFRFVIENEGDMIGIM